MTSIGNNTPVWKAVQWTQWSKVHHFKWHAGVITNLRKRRARDSGDCVIGVNEV
jgi:hypothetical protein